ncbi:DUF3304 domain-containing protein [Klebsiella pneumoniae]|uniref:DUF3304 domain-containing protein n=1 Tax=Klebsiella pneumoniae TaxID=573 RepID=UPI001330662B|nr:DUF3304 domain-containing protein [Klebsiella pneumoniae]
MKSALISPLLAGLLLLTGCAQPAAQAGGGGGGTIKAINHTKWAINHFSVNGQSGIDIIGPFQGGGGGCCFSVPARWTPGMTVHFLPCDDVKVTTSCWSPRNVNYPIKEPVRMTEPAVCPK